MQPMPRWVQLFAVAALGGAGWWFIRSARRPVRRRARLGDPKRIASESLTAEEYARRVEAWNSSQADPMSLTRLAKAWAGGRQAPKVMRLLREAREARVEGRERLWSSMARGLRGPLGKVRVRSQGPRDVVLDISDLTNDEVWDLNDVLDEVGTVTRQSRTDVFVRTHAPASEAISTFNRLAKAKGIQLGRVR